MMKFASFETIVAAIYDYLPGTKSDYSKGAQTGVAFVGGYMAGILCAIVSHPADVMVSKLNAERAPGESFGGAMSRIYAKIGFPGLWNGLPVRIVSSTTHFTFDPPADQVTSGYDRNTDRLAMDDLRLVQDLHGPADHWWWRREESRKDVRVVRKYEALVGRSMNNVYESGNCFGMHFYSFRSPLKSFRTQLPQIGQALSDHCLPVSSDLQLEPAQVCV